MSQISRKCVLNRFKILKCCVENICMLEVNCDVIVGRDCWQVEGPESHVVCGMLGLGERLSKCLAEASSVSVCHSDLLAV